MLEKFIKKDNNEKLEEILEKKEISEQAKNLLQGILYKIEVSYKDYKKAKAIETIETQYVENILKDIQKKCNKIQTIKLSEKISDKETQEELEKNKFYIDKNQIICYPIEKVILYAIEKNANNNQIVNNKYNVARPLSNLINTGKSIERVEPLRDFNGWSWTTINTEIENIKANLIYQTLQILLGEELINDWAKDTDGIIDYVEIMSKQLSTKFGEELSEEIEEKLFQIAIMNEIEENLEYKQKVEKKLEEVEKEFQKYNNTKENTQNITDRKKNLSKEIKEIEQILSQRTNTKKEYERINSTAEIQNKIFSIRIFKQKLNDKKQILLKEIEQCNYLLNPTNYLKEKEEIEKNRVLLEVVNYNEDEKENLIVEFEKLFLECFKKIVEHTNQEEIIKLIYRFRYFVLLPFNSSKNIKDIKQLEEKVQEIEKTIIEVAVKNKVINNVPFEIMEHVFQTRIVSLEELYFKIIEESDKYYVELFDENITEEKFEMQSTDKIKTNKKMKIFI